MPPRNNDEQSVSSHYTRADLAQLILDALRADGKDVNALTLADLAPVDQFHTLGHKATIELAQRAGLTAGMRVLDVGGGLGGPARTLASELGCRVEVLDITAEFCRVGALLTDRLKLSEAVTFRHGSALAMPYDDGAFDAVWTQHSTMNIADKQRLYRESLRVLRPGGRLALHEIMAGPVTPIHFPVPWARKPTISHLLTPDATHALITDAGFAELVWVDDSAVAQQWFAERMAAVQTSQAPLPSFAIHLVLGADFGLMFANVARNLAEDRARLVQGVFERKEATNT